MKKIKIMCRNNAGKFSHEHAISEDGIEMSFATNYLGEINNLFLIKYKLIVRLDENRSIDHTCFV